ncbi:DNA-binding transcriptional repressor AcrR [Actinomadura rubteroloni]|uniref:DNA-binding transcriptional repressor AcrR n=2 Tax=Actinomadura rubteroloni TaxID=1926885 RepID=A0A2P4ULZ3_9ACTN|nr:DNA-binding transcriptional repressor AcrR [Actinomadura rubteroloni]
MSPEERREQLLDAALLLINEGGVKAVTVDAVARTAEVTRPVVYGQFEDADDILRALLDREAAAALREFEASLPPEPGSGDPGRVAARSLRVLLTAIAQNPRRWHAILLPVGISPAPVQRRHRRIRAFVLERVTAFSAWGIEQRGLDLDPELLAHNLLCWVEECGRLILTEPDAYPPERLVAFSEQMIALFFGGPAGEAGRDEPEAT